MKFIDVFLRAAAAALLLFTLSACEWLHEISAPATPVAKQPVSTPVHAPRPEHKPMGHCANASSLALIEAQEFEVAYQRLDAELKKTPPSKQAVADRYCSQLTRSLLLLLPASPYYDLTRAQTVMEQLQEDEELADYLAMSAFDRIVIAELVALQKKLQALDVENATLRADLQKKSDALLKLKELTIGSQESLSGNP